jgi:hypothetical protein
VTGTHQGTWYNYPNYNTDAWSSKIDIPVPNGSPSFNYFYSDPDGSYIKDFNFENIYINGSCMTSLKSFPNGGALTFGDVSGLKFTCSSVSLLYSIMTSLFIFYILY